MATSGYKHLMCGVIATGAVLAYSHIGLCDTYNIEKHHKLPALGIDADTYSSYYKLATDNEIIGEQIGAINCFVTYLLDNTQDLNYEFSQTVDAHFWDLV